MEEKVSTLDDIYIYIYSCSKLAQLGNRGRRSVEYENFSAREKKLGRNLSDTFDIPRRTLKAITTPLLSSLSLSLTYAKQDFFATFVWYTKLATISPATSISIRFGACLGSIIRRDIDRVSITSAYQSHAALKSCATQSSVICDASATLPRLFKRK